MSITTPFCALKMILKLISCYFDKAYRHMLKAVVVLLQQLVSNLSKFIIEECDLCFRTKFQSFSESVFTCTTKH